MSSDNDARVRCAQALKGTRTVDRYALFWSPRPEFVRAAAKFQATIIPFGAVGCEEGSGAVLGSDSLRRVFGRGSAPPGADVPKARKGVNLQASGFNDDPTAVKLYLPRRFERWCAASLRRLCTKSNGLSAPTLAGVWRRGPLS